MSFKVFYVGVKHCFSISYTLICIKIGKIYTKIGSSYTVFGMQL